MSATGEASSEHLVSAMPPGAVLGGRYRIVAPIAHGAVASVYRADDERTGTPVALKILDPLRGADPVGRARFLREFEVLSRLSHPRIARSLALVTHDGLDAIALELIEGEPLSEALRRGRLPVERAVAIALEAASAVAACHEAGVIHRDLKPANIVLHPERGAVLLDFGMAWFSSAGNLTRTGAVIGTPQYIAPEVFSSSLHDARSDVYALGAIAFEMLAGHPPIEADSVLGVVDRHRRAEAPALHALRPEVGPELSRVVATAIAKDPEDRFATVAELIEALSARSLPARRALVARLPCPRCQTPLVIDLPICPGCGAPADWELSPGSYAVELREVADPKRAARWLRGRYPHAVAGTLAGLERRLATTPVPLIVDASKTSAEQLADEAGRVGASAAVIQAHSVLGAKLQVGQATLEESVAALGLHFAAVSALAAAGLVLGASYLVLLNLPVVVGIAGVLLARQYVRRPLLAPRGRQATHERRRELAPIAERLAALSEPRARRLAAGAIARAAPVLLGDVAGLGDGAKDDARRELERALTAVGAVDAHLGRLKAKPRARLGAELTEARGRVERGEDGAIDEVARLEVEKDELFAAAVDHDLAVAEALDATAAISRALSTRTLTVDDR